MQLSKGDEPNAACLKLSKQELKCLLAFSCTNPQSHMYGVLFKASASETGAEALLTARATTGQVACDAFGENALDEAREWFVDRRFLSRAIKLADKNSSVVLRFAGASLHDATIVDAAGNELDTYSCGKEGAAKAQSSFDDDKLDAALKIPERNQPLKALPLRSDCLHLIEQLANAADIDAATLHQPNEKSGDGRLVVEASGEESAWVAVVEPLHTDEDDDE